MPKPKFIRTGERTLNSVAYSKNLIDWMLDAVDPDKPGIYYPTLTARLFIAVLFDGVLHELGSILDKSWSDRPNKGKARAYLSVELRHKIIRELLGLVSDGTDREFASINPLLITLDKFRNSIAHPRIETEEFLLELESADQPVLPPQLLWQSDIDREKIKTEYEAVLAYCRELLHLASKKLKKLKVRLKPPYDNFDEAVKIRRELYPHIDFQQDFNLQQTIYRIEGLLLISETGWDSTGLANNEFKPGKFS